MTTSFSDMLHTRRSQYALGSRIILAPEKIQELLEDAVRHTPSAFNHQPGRMVALFGENHTRVWQLTWQALQQSVPAENLQNTRKKLDSFAAGYGTILYFTDQQAVGQMQKAFPAYAGNFPVWAQQSAGMLQYVVWCSLQSYGVGASLQHYNPLIDQLIQQEWDLPPTWQLVAQMPLGSVEAPPAAKELVDAADKVSVYF